MRGMWRDWSIQLVEFRRALDLGVNLVESLDVGSWLLGAQAMKTFDLTFSDGKRCRLIDMEGDGLPPTNFHEGYLVGFERVIEPPPAKLPWKKDGDVWRIEGFTLRKLDGGRFRVEWDGGSVDGGKDDVSRAVRENWKDVMMRC